MGKSKDDLQDIKEKFCNDFCKYPLIYDEEVEGVQLCESEYCTNCPLNTLEEYKEE